MGMPFRWYVHNSRTIYGKNYDHKSFQKLKCQSKSDSKKIFDTALAFAGKRDHRSYAQVLNGIIGTRTASHRARVQISDNRMVKRDVNVPLHNKVLGLNKGVTKEGHIAILH